MLLTFILVLAFLIGCVCGLRAMIGPAIICWGVHLGWLQLDDSKLAFLGSPISLVVFTALAAGELVADKLPFTPSRTMPASLVIRFALGALCGLAFSLSAETAWLPGASLAGIGAVAASYGGYHVRRWLTIGRGLPDFPVALVEDAVAVGMGLFLVSPVRFSGPPL